VVKILRSNPSLSLPEATTSAVFCAVGATALEEVPIGPRRE
jgi:hypothetical protein